MISEAIYMAATTRRREWRVTSSTMAFSLGNKLAPGLLDWSGAVVGVAAQKTTRKHVVDARDPNTHSPSTRPTGTHGPFDSESLTRSMQWTLNKSPAVVRLGLGLAALVVLGAAARSR